MSGYHVRSHEKQMQTKNTYHVLAVAHPLPFWPRRNQQSFHQNPPRPIGVEANSTNDKSNISSEVFELIQDYIVVGNDVRNHTPTHYIATTKLPHNLPGNSRANTRDWSFAFEGDRAPLLGEYKP